MIALLSFDVEEWFHGVPDWGPAEWTGRAATLEAELDRILAILDGTSATATFFFLDEAAAAHPERVRRAHDAGHEVASHGAGHRVVYELDPASFAASVRQASARLADITGAPVRGYRAPLWSLEASCDRAISVLLEAGMEYDSSILCRDADAPRGPFMLQSGGEEILEVPPGPLRLGPAFCPLAGSLPARLLPGALFRPLLRRAAARDGYLHAYLHPWEISTEARDLAGLTWEKRFFFTAGRGGGADRLERICRTFRPQSIAAALPALRDAAAGRARALDTLGGYRVRKDGLFQKGAAHVAG